MSGFLLVNPRSGDAADLDALLDAAAEHGIETRVLGRDDDAVALARAAAAPAIGVAGGDGSLAGVAAACIDRGLPFVCVPFGTRNHFARDIGLDRDDPLAALAAFGAGEERRVDVGRANELLFLNNVSLGAYARLVHRREHHRRRRDAFARVRALGVLARFPRPIAFTVDGESVRARLVLVGNNEYVLHPFSFGTRERLDAGRLHLYVRSGRLRHVWRDRGATRFVVDAGGHRIRAAVDGDPVVLETPIEFRIEPRALRVLVPRRPPA